MTGDKHDLRYGEMIDGRYRVGHEIGRGAMGVVYEAMHTRLDRRVALKVLLHDLASDPDSCERFEREARAASRIGSKHIVNVHDAGELPDGRRYLVLEHLSGETLKQRFERLAPLDPAALFPILEELLDGLAAAHDAGIVHRDIKPDNVFLVGADAHVKILDFGVSKFRDVGTNALQSRTGIVLGTPHYMAPEQARGERDVDRRADIFSVGVVAYEGLAGRRPFTADNVNQLLFSIALDDVPQLHERVAGIDRGASAIVSRATRRIPEQRYQSARELADDIRAWLDGDPLSAQTLALAEAPAGPVTHEAAAVSDEPTAEATMATFVGAAATASPRPVEEIPEPRRRPRWLLAALGAAVLALPLAALYPNDPHALSPSPAIITTNTKAAAPQPPGTQPPTPAPALVPAPAIAPAIDPTTQPLPRPPPPPTPSSKTPRPIRKQL